MLYTSMPLERIYHDYNNPEQVQEADKIIELPNGRVFAHLVDDHYEVNQLVSTDLGDYLKIAYMPGVPIDY